MRLSVRTNILSDRNKKAMTILIGFLLIVSGIFVATLNVGASAWVHNPRGARQGDMNNTTNDFAPDIKITQPGGPGYSVDMLNDGLNYTIIIVNVTDEDNYTTEGSDIASVMINLTSFTDKATSNPIGWVNMVDDGSIPEDVADDGNYTYNLSYKLGQPVGMYLVDFNATDNGTMPMWTNTYDNASLMNVTINVIQFNRDIASTPAGPIMMVEDGPDAYIELNDTVFYDPDLSDGNITDSLTFKVWDGDSWKNMYDGADFTVTIAAGEPGNVTFHPKPGQSTTGELVNFSAEDTGGHWRELKINVIITSVNDPPSWLNAPSFVEVTEGIAKNISVDAEDLDTSTLAFTAYMFIGDDDTNTSWELTVDEPVANTANISLMVDDKEVILDITGLSINMTVNDTEFIDWAIIELDVIGVNDDPMLEYGVPIASVDTDVDEDELGYNITFKATDNDKGDELEFGFTVDEYTGLDTSVEDKIDITTNDPTDATYDIATDTYTPGMAEAKLNFTPDNDDVGTIKINVTLTDGVETVWIVTDITIANTNDAPYFTDAAGSSVTTGDMLTYTGTNNVTVGEYLNITVEAADDDLIHGTETLTFSANASLISDTVLMIEKWGDTKANLSFKFPEAYEGTNIYQVEVSDGDDSDWFLIQIEVWKKSDVPPPPPPPDDLPPTLNITTQSGKKYAMGAKVVIEGDSVDPEGEEVIIMVKFKFPNGTAMDFWYITDEADIASLPDEAKNLVWHYIDIKADGTWTYTFDTKAWNNIAKYLGDPLTAGTYTLTFKAMDSYFGGEESAEKSVSFELEKAKDDGEDEEGLLGMGKIAGIDTFLLLLIIIIVVVIIIVAVVAGKKKKAKAAAAAEEEAALAPPPMEMTCTACGAIIPAGEATCGACGAAAPPPPEAVPPAEMTCTACGAIIPAGAATCGACGAAAPPPPEAVPPAEMTCTACGAIIPAGSPSCPTCGAAAPPPAEAPPEIMTCVTCGQVIPPGSPTCPACGAPAPPTGPPPEEMPPEGMPPAAPPPEGMPPEGAPPPEGMPPEGAPPPEGMPPAAPPPEGMPPEPGAPPEAAPPPETAPPPAEAPPPQMIPCPQCGGQLGVGISPCPNCGAQLNWG